MTRPSERVLRESGLAFFGAVAASLSHELNNVFATINELSGLLEDLALGGERGRPPEPGRIRNLTGRIATQVQRGQRQSRQLNQFAHSADEPLGRIDAGQVATEVVDLCQRLARLRKVQLQSTVPQDPIMMDTDPFLLRHVLWRGLELAISSVEPGNRVALSMEEDRDTRELQVSVTSGLAAAAAEPEQKLALLSALAEALGGHVEDGLRDGESSCLKVRLPRHLVPHGATRDDSSGNC
jgi:C4-dicarboxylate-specific signal transduction histidine kinase